MREEKVEFTRGMIDDLCQPGTILSDEDCKFMECMYLRESWTPEMIARIEKIWKEHR